MSTAARIDELRKKFEENPRRYFAPLANEYRKAGDLSQAIALCREFLPKQPGHMSGFIVFGQALYEASEYDEARSVFEQALSLDPENLIALRHLGDIARISGDAVGARRWYERVLDADPRNDDIAAQLATLGAVRPPVTVHSPTPTFESIAARLSTPPIPMDGIGYAVVPTPDSVMRAVDFDSFGAAGVTDAVADAPRPREHTPIDLDDVEDLGGAPDALPESTPEPVAEAEQVDPFDFDEPVEAFADVPFEAPVEAEPAPVIGTFAELAIIEDEESFEEGLIAANWPDTTELEARVMTPRSVTPFSVTPLSSAALDDAASAFGRGQEPTVAAYDDQTDSLESVGDTDLGSDAVEPLAIIDDLTADAESPVSFDAVTAEIEIPEAFDVPVSFEATRDEVESHGAFAPHGVFDADTVEMEIPSFDSAPSDVVSTPTELPWLAVSESPSELLQDIEESEPGLEEIAEVFADDARAAGDESAVTVAALEDPIATGESESFADVAQEIDDEAAEALEAEAGREVTQSFAESALTPAAGSPAFVTETMGELLVAQGFVARAIDVYDELVRRRPFDPVLSSRLEELRAMVAPPQDAPPVLEQHGLDAEPSFDDDNVLFDEFASPVLGDVSDMPTPPYGTPVSLTPVTGVSALTGMPYRTPMHSTPVHATPAHATPANTHQVTPLVTPYAQPAITEEFAPRRSAGEWFGALAARRVPRRTPSQSAPVVESSSEGLASLFGETSASHDDVAARALADAFAPLSEQDLGSAPSLDFTFTHTTPAFAPAVGTPSGATVVTPPRAPTPVAYTPAVSPPVVTPAGNAGFSFDKFFPDAATRRGTPAAPSPAVTDAPVTDDLAQFSAWLKGLGNS